MPRNLDLTALRSFVTVADASGVTRAAGILNLTQSAVSMQLKRLEESLGVQLLDRSARTIGLTPAGQQMLSYAKRMLALNDEIYGKLTAPEFEGELRLGVPHDVIYPRIPKVLKQIATDFPRIKVKLMSAPTKRLREMFARGECDIIVTTEERPEAGGETLVMLPLMWVGAAGGTAWKQRPLPIAFCSNCIFRPGIQRKLDEADIAWEAAVDSELDNAVDAAVSADLAVNGVLEGGVGQGCAPIDHGGALPDLGHMSINLYVQRAEETVQAAIGQMLRDAFAPRPALPQVATA